MSITISCSTRGRSVKAAAFISVNYSPPYVNSDGRPYTVYYQDLLLSTLRSNYFYFPGPTRSISRLFGYSLDDDSKRIIHSRKPFPPLAGDRHDEIAYASFLRGFQVFDSVITGRSLSGPSVGGEHEIRHTSFSGSLSASQALVPTVDGFHDFNGYTFECRNFQGKLIDYCRLDSYNPLEFTLLLRDHPGVPTYSLKDLLDFIIRGQSFMSFDAYGVSGWRSISNLRYASTVERLVITYHMVAHNNLVDITYEWDSKIVIPFSVPQSLNGAGIGDWVPVVAFANCEFSFTNWQQTAPSPDGSLPETILEDTYVGGYNSPFPISTPSPISAEESGFASPDRISRLDQLANNFRRSVDLQYRDLTTGALFSTVDAFQQAEGYLGTNILQNLAKIPDIASSLPMIKEGISVMSRILKRDMSLATLREVLNLATSTNLQANFQWRPFLSVFTEYIPLMISTFSSLGINSERAIGRGSFMKALPSAFGRESVTVSIRTKIVLGTSPKGLLSAILAVDALGALPKVSNLWDLIPFSFAANWFTGIGGAIRRAETSLLLATIPAYYVHTYKVTSPLTSKELSDLGATTFEDETACLVLFYRDVSFYTPTPRDSSLGFGIPSQFPPSGVLASLLYQLIFG